MEIERNGMVITLTKEELAKACKEELENQKIEEAKNYFLKCFEIPAGVSDPKFERVRKAFENTFELKLEPLLDTEQFASKEFFKECAETFRFIKAPAMDDRAVWSTVFPIVLSKYQIKDAKKDYIVEITGTIFKKVIIEKAAGKAQAESIAKALYGKELIEFDSKSPIVDVVVLAEREAETGDDFPRWSGDGLNE